MFWTQNYLVVHTKQLMSYPTTCAADYFQICSWFRLGRNDEEGEEPTTEEEPTDETN